VQASSEEKEKATIYFMDKTVSVNSVRAFLDLLRNS